MRLVLCFIVIFISNCCFAQTSDVTFFSKELRSQIASFIDTAQKQSVKKGQYNVYAVYIFKADSELCFSLGYICNSQDYKLVNPKYYTEINGKYVAIRFASSISKEYYKKLDVQLITSGIPATIAQKLYPNDIGYISGAGIAWQCCIKENSIKRTIYDSRESLPKSKGIFEEYYTDGTVEKVR